jgi:hypothetical protein
MEMEVEIEMEMIPQMCTLLRNRGSSELATFIINTHFYQSYKTRSSDGNPHKWTLTELYIRLLWVVSKENYLQPEYIRTWSMYSLTW